MQIGTVLKSLIMNPVPKNCPMPDMTNSNWDTRVWCDMVFNGEKNGFAQWTMSSPIATIRPLNIDGYIQLEEYARSNGVAYP